jgi:lysyl-tRNA synthetase class 2
VFICDWPAFETSSAQEKDGREIAERSELFICGVEISDGFPSLTNYERQKQTFDHQLNRRRADGTPQVALDESYMEAMRVGLPRGAGMALGFDRLVMILTNQPTIKSVLAFAWDEV